MKAYCLERVLPSLSAIPRYVLQRTTRHPPSEVHLPAPLLCKGNFSHALRALSAGGGVGQEGPWYLNPPPGVSTEAIEAGLDARKACIEERSVVGNYV
ncbi:MAG: hypothetical protein ACOX9B_06000, partial [Candidatus Xenobium sp.]